MSKKMEEENRPVKADFYVYHGHAIVPEIPYVQDIMYVFRLSDEDMFYEFGLEHHPPYIRNVVMTAARVADKLFQLDELDDATRQKLTAETIIELCPEEARCLFNPAYSEALALTGKHIPRINHKQLRLQCGCCRCRIRQTQENRFHACDD